MGLFIANQLMIYQNREINRSWPQLSVRRIYFSTKLMRFMKIFLLLLTLISFKITEVSIAQDAEYPLNGTVVDEVTLEPLPGASVYIMELNRAQANDGDGRFEFADVAEGSYTLHIRYLGYNEIRYDVNHPAEENLIIGLKQIIIAGSDVIVTASPLGRNNYYQPANAYDIQELQDRQASSFGEMLDGEPGIAMRSFGPAPSRPVIRGFDGDRLLILENGERMGDLSNTAHDHNISIDPLAADRIEVVRGPASLLYGSSALGGVVNIITSDIPREWGTGSSGSTAFEGSSMNDGLSGLGRYQYGGDQWAGTARFSYRGAGDVQTPDGKLPGTFIQNVEGAGGVGYRTSGFNGGISFSAIGHNFGLPEEIDDPDEDVEIRMNQQTFQGRGLWSTGHFFDQVEFRFHGSRLFQQEVEIEYLGGGAVDKDIELEFEQYAINSTLTARHKPAGFLNEGVVGINTHARKMEVGGDEAFTPGVENWSLAMFTYHEAPLSSISTLQFGVRGEVQSLSTRPNDDFPNMRESKTVSAFSGSIGVNIRPSSQFEFGAQFARAHRFPILEEMYADGVHFAAGVFERGNPSLGTEVGHGADLFVKWANNRIETELSGFYYRISDYVAFEPTGSIFIDDRNREWDVYEYRARNAELLGGEALVSLRLTDHWEAGASVDYVRGSITDYNSPLPTMPPLRHRIYTRYETGQWWIGGNLRIVNSQNRVVAEELPTDGYKLIGLNAGYRFGDLNVHRISLVVENLADTLYRDHLSRIDRSEFGFPMPGRNIRLSYRFIF